MVVARQLHALAVSLPGEKLPVRDLGNLNNDAV